MVSSDFLSIQLTNQGMFCYGLLTPGYVFPENAHSYLFYKYSLAQQARVLEEYSPSCCLKTSAKISTFFAS